MDEKKEKPTINDIFENMRNKYFNKDGDPIEQEDNKSSDIDELLQDDVDENERKKSLNK